MKSARFWSGRAGFGGSRDGAACGISRSKEAARSFSVRRLCYDRGVHRVGFILKPDKSQAGVLLEELVPWLREQGHVPVVTSEDQIAPAGCEVVPEDELGAAVDLLVVLGGDGTMLRAARLVADHGRPVLGINLGQLGFLVGFAPKNAQQALAEALAGTLSETRRMRLAVTLRRHGAEPVVRYALNDAVLHQGAMARLVEIDAFVDGHFVASYRADGLIVATPAGSTAYNMAAGGPIMMPTLAAMTLTPICAHALTNRPLVISATNTIRLELGADVRGVLVTVDAQWGHSFLPGDTVEISAAASPLVMYASRQSFFDVMRDKLHWGARSDRGAHKGGG
jgi:NAD+ kinase